MYSKDKMDFVRVKQPNSRKVQIAQSSPRVRRQGRAGRSATPMEPVSLTPSELSSANFGTLVKDKAPRSHNRSSTLSRDSGLLEDAASVKVIQEYKDDYCKLQIERAVAAVREQHEDELRAVHHRYIELYGGPKVAANAAKWDELYNGGAPSQKKKTRTKKSNK